MNAPIPPVGDANRRDFVRDLAAGAVGVWSFGAASGAAFGKSANERLRIACIGVGGKGHSDAMQAANVGDVVAICDVDETQMDRYVGDVGKRGNVAAKAKRFRDYRKLLEEMGNGIDAVTVSVPDHSHAAAALMAMRMGKHAYVQKPLARTPYECRLLRQVAAEKKLVTQMGNQGSAENGLRSAVELVHAGLIGHVKEVHVWTNRPVWPQAPTIVKRPDGSDPIPATLDWDCWLGPAPVRPYKGNRTYHDFNWRGWWDFGTGAMGDMACHTANMAFRAAKLGLPTKVKSESGELNPETFPAWAKIAYDFPARDGLPACQLHWYEGRRDGWKMLPPAELILRVRPENGKLADSGSIIVGEKAILFSPDDYGAAFKVVNLKGQEIHPPKTPHTLPRNGKGDQGMKDEWAAAIHAGKPENAYSNFAVAATMTEGMLVGNASTRLGGKELEYDGAKGEVTNCADAAQYIKPTYRRGWTLE